MLIPLKQGLKLLCANIILNYQYCLNVDSIKTRIETVPMITLFMSSNSLKCYSIKTRIETENHIYIRERNCGLNVDSIKTRIETYFEGYFYSFDFWSEC